MGRKGSPHPAGLKEFLALLQKSDLQDVPPSELWEDAGSLCQRLQHSPAGLEKLMEAMARGRHWEHLCSSLHVVQACVLVHLRKDQHGMACKLLESCTAVEKEKLVKLWYEIHYHEAMKKRHTTSLTPVQKYRCRKRNPPPASLCPGGVKNRNYPAEVRQRLQRFAVEVTANPNQEQREALARGTSLQPSHIYGWFANYRRRRKPQLSQAARPGEEAGRQKKGQREGKWADGLGGASGTEEREVPLPPTAQPEVQQPRSPLMASWLRSSGAQGRWLGTPAFLSRGTVEETKPVVLEVTWEPASPVPSPWGEGPAQPPARSCLAQQLPERLPISGAAPKAVHKGVQCSLGSWDVSRHCNCSRAKRSLPTWPGGARMAEACGAAGSQTLREQADSQLEALVLQRQQLTVPPWLASALPGSPFLNDPVSTEPYLLEENQDVAQAEVPWDHASNPFYTDTFWAASLLCEFSSGGSA